MFARKREFACREEKRVRCLTTNTMSFRRYSSQLVCRASSIRSTLIVPSPQHTSSVSERMFVRKERISCVNENSRGKESSSVREEKRFRCLTIETVPLKRYSSQLVCSGPRSSCHHSIRRLCRRECSCGKEQRKGHMSAIAMSLRSGTPTGSHEECHR